MKRVFFLNYVVLIVLITVLLLLMYAVTQQVYRTGMDDPQVQMARDIAVKLKVGKRMEEVLPADTIDLARSLAPFVVLYDTAGMPLRSSGILDGTMPRIPVGLFQQVSLYGEHRVTWQPRPGVRMAMVIASVGASPVQFVAAGRSMRETEQRTTNMSATIFIAWVTCISILILAAFIEMTWMKTDEK